MPGRRIWHAALPKRLHAARGGRGPAAQGTPALGWLSPDAGRWGQGPSVDTRPTRDSQSGTSPDAPRFRHPLRPAGRCPRITSPPLTCDTPPCRPPGSGPPHLRQEVGEQGARCDAGLISHYLSKHPVAVRCECWPSGLGGGGCDRHNVLNRTPRGRSRRRTAGALASRSA
ncbi:hypothetical protein AAFF_G00156710 [Aldrovandia affinis]|uniref:Uncharacterized protein n=1 Tax=Aldrovandia affinis TaxID=143900 RepID=A0AAD7W8J7_9TELE|nr:hypothetical protein AAFF_G00156710 [Aldrovandia affinis]